MIKGDVVILDQNSVLVCVESIVHLRVMLVLLKMRDCCTKIRLYIAHWKQRERGREGGSVSPVNTI